MNDNPLATIALIELLYIGVVVTTFIIFYAARSTWWSTRPGQALMSSKVTIAVVIWLSLATALFGQDWPGRYWVRVLIFGGIAISQTWLLWVLLKVQGFEKRQDKAIDDEDNARTRTPGGDQRS